MKSRRNSRPGGFWDRPMILAVRHRFSNSEAPGLLVHVMVANVEHSMLLKVSLSQGFVKV
jgi:hypothetical protein